MIPSVDALLKAIYGPPPEDDRYEFGLHVSIRIGLVCEHLPVWSTARQRFLEVAERLQRTASPNESAADISQAERGFVGGRPILAALVARSGSTASLPGDALRAYMLMRVWLEQTQSAINSADWAQNLHAFLKKWDQPRTSDFNDHEQLSVFLRSPSDGAWQAARLATAHALDHFEASKAAKKDAHRTLDFVATSLITDKEFIEREAAAERITKYLASAIVEGAPREIGGTSRSRAFLSEVSDSETRSASIRYATERSGWLIARSLVPGSDAALDAAECKAATAFLAELTGGVGVLETAQAQAALVALLALITSEGHKDLVHDLRNPGDDNLLVSLNDRWYVRRIIPNGDEHARAERRAGSESFRFLLPLPEQLLAELNAIRGAPNQLIAWGLFEDEEKKLLRRLRAEVTPRYTEGRARLALPSHIFSRTEDPTRAQLLTGSSLGQSDGGLAYYGQWYREITENWRDDLRDVFGLDVRLDDAIPDRWIGAPLAAVRDEQIATLVRLYQQPVEAALQVGDPVAIHDALAIYLCRKFQALTGHRGFKSIGKVLLVDVLLAGACSTEDKPRDSSPGRRLAIIGVNYVRELQHLVRLRQHIANKESEVTPGLRDQCALEGHVFWLIAEGRRVKRSDIAPPRETCLPVNIFRSRLRMQLTRRGVRPRYIFGQLGHIWNGEAPFSFHTTESVIEVIDRLGPVLEQMLKDDGWKVFNVPTRLMAPQKTAPWPMPCLVENFGKVEAWSFGDSEAPSRGRRRFPVEQKQEHLEWVVGSLKKLYARYPKSDPVSYVPDRSEKDRFGLSVNLRERSSAPNRTEFVPRNVVLTESDVEDLVRQLIIEGEGSPARVGACLRMLRARVIWNRRRFAWSGVLPPLAIEPEPVIQAISRVHVAAANLASKIRERIVSLESLGGSDKVHARWGRLIVLLVLDHALFDEAQLKDAIDTLSTLDAPIPDHGAYAGIVELRFGQAIRAVRLSSEALLLANSVRGTTSAGLSEIKRRLANDLGDSLGAGVIRALLSVADCAARINLPGLDWICVERGDPGTLDLERTRDLLEGRCGGETRQCNSAGPEDEARIQARLSQQRASLPSQRHTQYKKLRRELNDLREPGAGQQGVPGQRFARAHELLVTTIRDPATDRLVAMLASYAFMFVGGGKSERTRISTGYGAMTTIGLRLLRALGSRALEDCSITELFLGVVAAD